MVVKPGIVAGGKIQLSIIVGTGTVTVASQAPGSVVTVILPGHVSTGTIGSSTITVTSTVAVFPCVSVAVI